MVVLSDEELERSKSYMFWKMAYEMKAVDISMLMEATKYKDITPEEFELITGKKYIEELGK